MPPGIRAAAVFGSGSVISLRGKPQQRAARQKAVSRVIRRLLTLLIQSDATDGFAAISLRANRFLQRFHPSGQSGEFITVGLESDILSFQRFCSDFQSGKSVGVGFELRILGFQSFDLLSQFLGDANIEHRDCIVVHAFQIQAFLAI
jgi:hypothetical protein